MGHPKVGNLKGVTRPLGMENDDFAMYFIVESIHGERVHALLNREAWLEANIEPLVVNRTKSAFLC